MQRPLVDFAILIPDQLTLRLRGEAGTGWTASGLQTSIISSRSARFIMPDIELSNQSPGKTDMMPILKDIFHAEGIPQRLVWLAEVESSLDPDAESRAGAVGLFQLMPDAAQRFGLKLSPIDDRRIPEKSARAAAAYLRQLHKEFGCWLLALAAYNAGEGRVSRTMNLYKAKTFSELAPHLPAETRQYVPRVMMTIALREDQARGVPAACRAEGAAYLP